ncbi:MAG: hypothetical protein VYB54_15725 [Pseudomonadota bacterium]|nr:hypothetical protein [Pseudomonadota bacterium]
MTALPIAPAQCADDAIRGDQYEIPVSGDEMYPTLRPGDVAYACKGRRVRPGDYVNVFADDGRGGGAGNIRRLHSIEVDGTIVLEQFRPQRKIRIQPGRVRAIHRIVAIIFTP